MKLRENVDNFSKIKVTKYSDSNYKVTYLCETKAKNMKATTLNTEIKKETEKAILITVLGNGKYGNIVSLNWWLPKSKVIVNGNEITAPNWLLSAKLAESNVLNITVGNQIFDKLNFM